VERRGETTHLGFDLAGIRQRPQALTETTPERAGTQQDHHSKLMMPNGITKPCDRELITEQQNFGTQVSQSQQDQQNWKPTGRNGTASPF
tara:strand:- start:278 stop:547 length:270 start_codon:yes stop_codon:yes gene_type:complete